MAAFQSISALQTGTTPSPDVVEIGLLLPTCRVNALIELSKRKNQSVGRILRDLIDRALLDDERSAPPDELLDPFMVDDLGTFV